MKNKNTIILCIVAVYIAFALSYCQQLNKNQSLIEKYKDEIAFLIAKHKEELAGYKYVTMTVTAYTACVDECDIDPTNTAIMEKPVPGLTVAVSRDKSHLLGRTVYIEGWGVRRINDLMNARYKNRIDVLVKTKIEARIWGKKEKRVVIL